MGNGQPPGWETYDGAVYTPERGYGWLSHLAEKGSDDGADGVVILPDGTRASPRALGRLELANWQGTHPENRPLVFRLDLPDGWYQVTCTSVWPVNLPLPLVDQRSIKFRAHDVVFAGPSYGAPLKVEGNRLVEGAGMVEVSDGHLRIVVGDPAYGGWTWSYPGPWWSGWKWWWKHPSVFAKTWYQKIARFVDPGFHSLRFNALAIERVPAPVQQSVLVFRDFFNRDDSPDMNQGLAEAARWLPLPFHSVASAHINVTLAHTALTLTAPARGKGVIGVVQQQPSPQQGIMRYATRVSLFTGEGSKSHAGSQEAGLLMLGDPTGVDEFNATFVGVAYDSTRRHTPGWVTYRVGNGREGYRTEAAIPDVSLPFSVTEGEYDISVEHDVDHNVLRRIRINGVDLTHHWSPAERQQRLARGVFGVRGALDADDSGVRLQQFYWYYRVEDITASE